MKKEKGITLVSLVVTIIILIILAGVSINLTLGKNGIITIAKQAKENTELAKIEEETALNELYMQIEAEGGTSGENSYDFIAKLVEFKEKIATAITNKGIETSKDATADVMAENIGKIDATEKLLEFKTAIANYIEEAGGVKPETTADTATFGESIKGILKEATKDATATAEDIAEGKTAYVNGELITGNGAIEIKSGHAYKIIISVTGGIAGAQNNAIRTTSRKATIIIHKDGTYTYSGTGSNTNGSTETINAYIQGYVSIDSITITEIEE